MAAATDDSRLARLEGQMELVVQGIQDMREEFRDVRAELRAVNNRIDRLTLAVLGVGGGVIVALISLAGVLAIQLIRTG